jgi:hypothetical protein
MNTTVVLDPSAIRAYARGSLAVGELLMLLGEDGNAAALPAVAMADAFNGVVDVEMLRHLMSHDRTHIVPLDHSDVEGVGSLGPRTSLGLAHAVVTSRRLDSYLVTAKPKAVEGLIKEGMIIEV